MAHPVIEASVVKGAHPHKRMVISWVTDNGQVEAVTDLVNHFGVLHREDGVDRRVVGEHKKACEKAIEEQGYSFRRR